MDAPLHILEHLAVPYPKPAIACRLGQRRGVPQALDNPRFSDCARRAYALCEPRGRYRLLPIRQIEAEGIRLEDGTLVPGARFAALCGGQSWLWCAAVTVGAGLVAAREALTSLTEQSIYDAVGSECADAAMDALQSHARQLLLSQGVALAPRRYSPGYGDMPLSVQRLFDRYLDLNAMGVVLTDSFMMLPEKSVTAWAGAARLQGAAPAVC